jgi:hypothetical protein
MDRGFVYPSGPVLRSTVARSSAGSSTMRSNFVLPALLFVIALPFQSCVKDTAEIAQEVGLLPAGCGSDGARLQATVGGSSYCATAQLLAVGGEGSVMLTGVDLSGNTLILQLDTLGVGTHAITEASNSMVYMQAGSSFVTGPDSEGTLIIEQHNASTRRLKGTFAAPVFNELSGETRQAEGQFDVTYTIGG